MDITVAITTFNEDDYLDRLLEDLAHQNCSLSFEIILVEAGEYDNDRAKRFLGHYGENLVFHHHPGLSRTKSLNLICNTARGDLIVRLDGRSHVDSDYLMNIYNLSIESGAENVGGVMTPIGLNEEQMIIAAIMKHPLSFGGAKARRSVFRGFADSVYLGAFRKNISKGGEEWFDTTHPAISEDSDLNYRIRKNGGKIFIDSSIVVWYRTRGTLTKFFKLCFNYGVGRGLFIIKHRVFSAYRQLAPPLSFAFYLFLLVLGLFQPLAWGFLLFFVSLYLSIILVVSFRIASGAKEFTTLALGFIGCHVFWTFGLLYSPVIFSSDLRNAR